MAKLKVFGGNFDGRNRMIVATTSQKSAAELMRVSISAIRDYGNTSGNAEEVALATANVGVVYTKPDNYISGTEWIVKYPAKA